MNRILLVLCSACLFCVPPVQADDYAFLVAVGDYDIKQLKPLKYTRNDISEFHQVLLDSGFQADNVVLMHDDLTKLKGGRRYVPEADKIRKELDLLLKGLHKNDSVVVAFSGHGVEFTSDGKNYFCPADTDLDDRKKLVSLTEIYDKLKACPAQRKLLLVDACRNDPRSELSKSTRPTVKLESVSRPQQEAIPKGIIALFSCAPGEESFEYPELQHGIFFHHVLKGWKGEADGSDGALDLDELVNYTTKQTTVFARKNLASVQTPQRKGDFSGTWMLRKSGSVPIPFTGTRAGQERDDNALKLKLCWCPAGSFTMGSPPSELDRDDDEGPVSVTLTKGYWLGKYEVTQGEWRSVMGTTIAQQKAKPNSSGDITGTGARQPMYFVDHDEATVFCQKLTESERRAGRLPSGWVYRLPSEAEWEYACRAGTTSATAFGNSLSSTQANFDGDYPYNGGVKGVDRGATIDVGSLNKPNAWGLHDLHGNVWEWCADWYVEKLSGGKDPVVLQAADASRRVYRGGGWDSAGQYCRSANRYRHTAGFRDPDFDFGFRIAVGPEHK